jgi:serine/threonine protein kinase
MICRSCLTQVEDGHRFCPTCGAEQGSGGTGTRPTPPPDPLVGSVIDEKYRLDSRIGVGGMGSVYRATRLLIGDSVAVKVLHAEQLHDPNTAERFRREAQAAARLKHPNAVAIHDFGVSSEGMVYLVMELVEGDTLRRLIKEHGPLAPSAVSEILTQVCGALDAAHQQNIVHRDIKPDNIVVALTGTGPRVKVLDFGIARLRDLKVLNNLTQTGSVVGTPHYMSPEQCLGEELDARSDIYSLGVVLYEMLAGIVPFNSPTSMAVVVQHVNAAPASLRALNMSIPAAVEAVVLRALEKRRDARPQTAGALADEFAAAVRGGLTMDATPLPGSAALTGAGAAYPPTVLMSTPGSTSAVASEVPDRRSPGGAGNTRRARRPSRGLTAAGAVVVAALIGAGVWAQVSRAVEGGGAGKALPSPSPSSPDTPAAVPASAPAAAPAAAPTPAPTPPEVHDWSVVVEGTSDVTNATAALGARDDSIAVIAPGGALAVRFIPGRGFSDADGADIRVYGPAGQPTFYRLFARDEPGDPWVRFDTNRRGFLNGAASHDMGHHRVRHAHEIMILNEGSEDLRIDAIEPLYPQP